MTALLRSALSIAFLALATGIYAAALVIGRALPRWDGAAVVAAGLTVDLVVVVPGLYYLLVARPRRWPAVTVVPVFLVSLMLAGVLVPRDHREVLVLLRLLVVPLEATALAYVAVHAARGLRRFRREQAGGPADALRALRTAARSVVRQRVAAGVLAFELAVLAYALGGWRSPPPAASGGDLFSGHRRHGYGAVLVALGMAAVVELVGVHVLVVALWGTAAAWVLTSISLYGTLWVVADWRALGRRPITLAADRLELRVGLRWDLTIPFDRIAALRRLVRPVRAPGALDLSVFGPADFELELIEPLVAEGVYGLRWRATVVRFQMDEPERFETLFRARAGLDGDP